MPLQTQAAKPAASPDAVIAVEDLAAYLARLTRLPADARFGFNAGGLRFDAAISAESGTRMLRIWAFGPDLPYSIEDRPRRARLLRDLAAQVPGRWPTLALYRQTRLLAMDEVPLPADTDPRDLVTLATASALRLMPLILASGSAA